MGNSASRIDNLRAAARSAVIDMQIEEDSMIFRRKYKFILLGESLSFKLAVRV
jgi:hypothetical protein